MKVQLRPDVEKYGLSPGVVYDVVNVSKYAGSNRKINFTVLVDGIGQPARFDSDLFDIVDPLIDRDWVVEVYEDGLSFSIRHAKLSYQGFWEDFYGDDNELRARAIGLFKEVYPNYKEL